MKKLLLVVLLPALFLISCVRTWTFQPIEAYRPASAGPPASACQPCHAMEYTTWSETRHSDGRRSVSQSSARRPIYVDSNPSLNLI